MRGDSLTSLSSAVGNEAPHTTFQRGMYVAEVSQDFGGVHTWHGNEGIFAEHGPEHTHGVDEQSNSLLHFLGSDLMKGVLEDETRELTIPAPHQSFGSSDNSGSFFSQFSTPFPIQPTQGSSSLLAQPLPILRKPFLDEGVGISAMLAGDQQQHAIHQQQQHKYQPQEQKGGPLQDCMHQTQHHQDQIKRRQVLHRQHHNQQHIHQPYNSQQQQQQQSLYQGKESRQIYASKNGVHPAHEALQPLRGGGVVGWGEAPFFYNENGKAIQSADNANSQQGSSKEFPRVFQAEPTDTAFISFKSGESQQGYSAWGSSNAADLSIGGQVQSFIMRVHCS